jgi:hypothetical protein
MNVWESPYRISKHLFLNFNIMKSDDEWLILDDVKISEWEREGERENVNCTSQVFGSFSFILWLNKRKRKWNFFMPPDYLTCHLILFSSLLVCIFNFFSGFLISSYYSLDEMLWCVVNEERKHREGGQGRSLKKLLLLGTGGLNINRSYCDCRYFLLVVWFV